MNPQQWYVLVEEKSGYQSGYRWDMTAGHPATDFEHALALAQATALYHVPKNPMRPKSRALFRTPDGGWLVWVEGATANFHFRVSVAEYYGVFPGRPQG